MVKRLFLCTASTPPVEFSALPDERIHQHSPIPPEDNHLEESLSQPRSQSRTEIRLSLTSNPQLPVDGMNAEPVGLVANASTVSLDLGNRDRPAVYRL